VITPYHYELIDVKVVYDQYLYSFILYSIHIYLYSRYKLMAIQNSEK